ncbi:hypothetical protein [Streptomyces thermolilacinus]|uniref:DUF732 domain-containing protein n=1 Tax=Streptomyces thermolilacinus SPC6 TaxID=1306406 RepID=A0A1D3DUH6_9ACTN|nr:hypothetical protein [Streptomyces thermolilacinus]OEJ95973.1 hypothetical protein J116_017320 [Streptomyces thermolilacinus SPC6]
MRTHLRRPVATSLALAAALALAGCSSGDSGRSGDPGSGRTEGAAAPATAPASLSAAERVAGEQDGAATTGPSSAPGAAPAPEGTPAGPVRPDAALTPATGSFTPKEKRYLSGRVPQAVDPAAVLDVGKETCQRISRTAKHDKDAAAAAVVAGDLRDADDAVTHLCPDQRPVLDAAEGGYPDGTHASPAAGRYRTVSAGPGCSWQVTDAKGTRVAGGPAPGATGPHTLTIPPGAARFESSGCYAWLRA